MRALVRVAGTWGLQLGVVLKRLAEATAAAPAPPASPTVRPAAPAGYRVEASGLTFAYGPRAEPVVRDLDLAIAEGDHLAVVGPSGIGKSTLAYLLAGLALPQRGTVRLGGLALQQIDPAELRRTVALIPQQAYVFAGSLRENLLYLAAGAGDDELDHAVAAVGLAPTLERLGDDRAMVGSGGHQLSAGERQLVALVRAYLSPASIVLLDEATCHLDPTAEAQAELAFAERDGTLVVIAHRISSALRAGRVLVMDGSRPQLGSHQELLATSPLYADLVGRWQDAPSRAGAPRSLSASAGTS